ncbi:MAG: helix-turn-helix domain-containing protein [Cypionkella sp.]|uniref:helix-turn-helix domain-containing protein n=1 Tax=Cypionkella sp. TaxID=2811411 RepID=UPI002ABCC6CF|nr:helix-turn-helix domain-containing protein [Cypionkella sp.]MDZ4311977.1 helix-turn-helix domain-containing protein [Cypionkella sp.]
MTPARPADPIALPDQPGLYDGDPQAENDLWFLPEDAADDAAQPGPRADRAPLFNVQDWRMAEANLAGDLAALCFDFGRLQERLSNLGAGALHRLALQEVVGLGWWTGERITADRLALWLSLRQGATGDESQALARAAWAVRRLQARSTSGSDWVTRISGQLGLVDLPPDRIFEVAASLDGAETLHRVTQGALLFHLWRAASDGVTRDIEAAVLGARIAAQAGFLPLAQVGFGALTVIGSAERRLSGWIGGAHQAVLAALLHLDRVQAWQGHATQAVADLSGRTPALLVALLARWPMMSAPMAEAETGASRAAVQRNLQSLTQRNLIREVTGQGRYRLWAARI